MFRPPYPRRTEEKADPSDGIGASAQLEERCLAAVLLLAGLIGLAIGLSAPRAHPTELVLGFVLAALGLWTVRPRVGARTEEEQQKPAPR